MKKINVDCPIPKYFQVKESIKEGIIKRKWKEGEQLPTYRQLAKYFNVTPVTISKALELLKEENLLYTIQGKGTFLSYPKEESNSFVVGVMMSTTGHVFEIIFKSLIRKLGKENYHILPVDTHYVEEPLWKKEIKLKRLLERKPDALIIDGETFFPFPLLLKYKEKIKNLTFLYRFETDISFNGANLILSDYYRGGYIAAKHLLENGTKKIIFYTFFYPGNFIPSLGPKYLYHWQVIEGIKSALKEFKLKPERSLTIVLDETEQSEKLVIEFLNKGYTGVICMGDFRASKIYKISEKMGLRVGRDISVIGYFNTPWTEIFSPKLTSISTQEEEIADNVALSIIKNWQGKKVNVKPVLVVRESTKKL